ncbi:leucine-rich repeat-containing protein 18-like [Lampris incognitus]|uniref:leucine-rich repeat-containing protein 18-like n=1 Tax=Lampris incognitus TaxID=2546036 RepID=UPI0024B5FFF0|nr:leucine-rich repeat-containing protein 18-like [Lampris incognitus]
MAEGKKKSDSKASGKKITLKMAKNCLMATVDGKQRLDLSNKGISTMPKCILELRGVEELDLSRNLLTEVPDFIGKFVNLHFLDLHSNYLDRVSAAIGRLQNLVNLNLCNNRLTPSSLPGELGLLGKLRKLNLGLNQLDTLPTAIGALKELRQIGLFDNRLTRYPGCLLKLHHLERVNIQGNPILPERPPDPGPVRRVECLCLVRESCLCGDCLMKCQKERKRLEETAKMKAVKSKPVSPDSVVRPSQETWRKRHD